MVLVIVSKRHEPRNSVRFSNSSGSDVAEDPSRLIARQQFRRRLSPRLILETDVGELLAAAVANDRAGVQFLDCPKRREAGLRLNAKRSPEFNGK